MNSKPCPDCQPDPQCEGSGEVEAALRSLVEMCEAHLPKIDGKTYTASEGGYFIERELRIAREALRDG